MILGNVHNGYGSSNHGLSQHLDKILKLTPKSLLDVGCGYNQFSADHLKKLGIHKIRRY